MRQITALYPSSNPGEDFAMELIERQDFQDAINEFRNFWEIDPAYEIYLREIDEKLTDEYRLFKNKKFIPATRKLQKKFGLGEEWSSFIEEYIFIDVLTYKKMSNLYIEKRTEEEADDATGDPAYYLRIFPSTTLDDLKKAWPEVNEFIHSGMLKRSRQKPHGNFKRDRKIYKLAQIGFSIEDIAEFFKKHHKMELDYATIVTAESRYRKKMGIAGSSTLRNRKGESSLTSLQVLVSEFPDE